MTSKLIESDRDYIVVGDELDFDYTFIYYNVDHWEVATIFEVDARNLDEFINSYKLMEAE